MYRELASLPASAKKQAKVSYIAIYTTRTVHKLLSEHGFEDDNKTWTSSDPLDVFSVPDDGFFPE